MLEMELQKSSHKRKSNTTPAGEDLTLSNWKSYKQSREKELSLDSYQHTLGCESQGDRDHICPISPGHGTVGLGSLSPGQRANPSPPTRVNACVNWASVSISPEVLQASREK